MRFGCEYKLKNGTVGLMIFNAKSLEAAKEYTDKFGAEIIKLSELIDGIEEIYKLFSRRNDDAERSD